jgi:hypothetical protein
MALRSRLVVRAVLWSLLITLVPAVLAACSSEEGRSEADRQVAIYGVVLDWVLDREQLPGPGAEPDETPTVFVDHLGHPIDLEVQVGLVGRFEDRFDLRFVDSLSEAMDEEAPGSPVRDGAVLIGLGAVPDDSPLLVRAEIYRDVRTLNAYRFEVARWAGQWVLRGEPESIEAEGFARE